MQLPAHIPLWPLYVSCALSAARRLIAMAREFVALLKEIDDLYEQRARRRLPGGEDEDDDDEP